jgi:hypothetical protein
MEKIASTVSVLPPKQLCEQIGLSPSDIEGLVSQINPFA